MAQERSHHLDMTNEDATTQDKHVHFFSNLLDSESKINKQEVLPNGNAQIGELETPAEGMVASKKMKRNTGQRPCRFFARGKCSNGEKCKFSHRKAMKKHKKENDHEASDADSTLVEKKTDPAQPVEALKVVAVPEPKKKKKMRARKCKFFSWNKCRDGDKCKFSHELKNAGAKSKSQRLELDLPPHAVVVQLGATMRSVNSVSNDSSEWSEVQQRALDLALKKYSASMEKEDRWASIANEVDGRSMNECIDRFKMLCELMRRGVDPTTAIEKQEEETAVPAESERHAMNSRITPPEKRVAIATEPDVKGTQIYLENLFLHEVGTLVAHQMACQLQCDNCPLTFDATLSLDSAEIQKWCPRCSVLHHVLMRPVFAHLQSNVLAYVDTGNCSIVDVLPSDMLATCLECGCEALLERVAPGQRSEQVCFSCHSKLAVMAKRFVAGQVQGPNRERNNSLDDPAVKIDKSKQKVKKSRETSVLGQPLPRNGACDHYRHSLRWFRFQCSGKAFPCNVCHDSSDCPQANLGKLASRMICGLCSKEQSSSVKVCSCGNDVAAKKSMTHHWGGGTGCRNYLLMSRWDKQKHRGQNKTGSTKFSRVGAEAKTQIECPWKRQSSRRCSMTFQDSIDTDMANNVVNLHCDSSCDLFPHRIHDL